jgi:hypothetical protein
MKEFYIIDRSGFLDQVQGEFSAVCRPRKSHPRIVRNNLGSSLSWLRFENTDIPNHKSVAPYRAHPRQSECRRLKQYSPLTLATLSTAGNSKHVEIAHQAAFQLRI